MAQCAKPLLIGRSVYRPDGLRALADLGSNPGLEEGFQLNYASGHAMRLSSQTGTEGSPVSSLNCDRPSHPEIRVSGS